MTAAHPAPLVLGDQELTKKTTDGRFSIYKTGQRERGARGAAPFSLYSVHDSDTGRIYKVKNTGEIDSLIHYRRTGEQLGKWFNNSTPAPKATLVKVGGMPSDATLLAALGPCGR